MVALYILEFFCITDLIALLSIWSWLQMITNILSKLFFGQILQKFIFLAQ